MPLSRSKDSKFSTSIFFAFRLSPKELKFSFGSEPPPATESSLMLFTSSVAILSAHICSFSALALDSKVLESAKA